MNTQKDRGDILAKRIEEIVKPYGSSPAIMAISAAIGEYRAPWTLGRSVNGFTLGEGQEWHRNDFTEDMLPEGWRPLLLDEKLEAGDVFLRDDTDIKTWKRNQDIGAKVLRPDWTHYRTRRPLPEVKKSVPLGPEDVPPGSAVRHGETLCWQLVLSTGEDCVFIEGDHIDFEDLQKDEWKISRDGGKTWEACSK